MSTTTAVGLSKLLLNEMEAAGLVLRRRDPADRPRHIVEERETLRQLLIKALEG